MNKYSIIIPTMWRGKELKDMLAIYDAEPHVGEVIVIDNEPGKYDKLPFKKVRLVTKGHNLYVNPSWNWGVKLSKYSYIIIANDDLFIPADKLAELFNILDTKLKPGMIFGPHYKMSKGRLRIKHLIGRMNRGFGTYMILHKDSYNFIPEDLKLWRGDYMQFISNKPYSIQGLGITSEMSVTLKSTNTLKLAKRDYIVWKKYAKTYSSKIRWLTKAEIDKCADPYWHRSKTRFQYIRAAIEELKKYDPESILEIGPGPELRIANIATTIDIDTSSQADIIMDVRNTPWQLGRFDCVVALQVFEHLEGKQKKTFKEAYKVARKALIISIPYRWTQGREGHVGLDNTTMLAWSGGIKWDRTVTVGKRRIYIWNKAPS